MDKVPIFTLMHNRPIIGIALLLLTTIMRAQGDIEKLPPAINTIEYDESSPVLSQDGLKLFFTRTADPDFESAIPDGQGKWVIATKDEQYQNQLSEIYSEIAGTKHYGSGEQGSAPDRRPVHAESRCSWGISLANALPQTSAKICEG